MNGMRRLVALAAMGVGIGCSPSAGDSNAGGIGQGSAPGSGASTGTGSFQSGTGGDGTVFMGNVGGSRDTPPQGADAACQSVQQRAEKTRGGKADIIWALDNSGSMLTEALGVQGEMNVFSQFISSTGIDVHVVMISSPMTLVPDIFNPSGPLIQSPFPPYGVCIGVPLGTGQCPNDSNPPPNGVYMHVVQEVDSHNALEQFMGTYPQWQNILRADATKTLVVITDDEANAAPTTAEFTTFFNTQFAGAPLWRFSGVYCIPGGQGGGNCAGTGDTYDVLVNQTGGVKADMGGTPNWQAIRDQLADAVIADAKPVDCEWVIPAAPDGETFDRDRVNVRFTPGSGVPEPLYFAADPSECSEQFLGWYYDNPTTPSKVIACPQTCPTLQADTSAAIEVLFGCQTERPPIR